MFADWCAATDHQAVPANPATVLTFLQACPATAGTQRRRVAAIDYHHLVDAYPAPGDHDEVRASVGRPPRERVWVCRDRAAIDTALRALPSHGFTAGLFGQRDRALLVLAQLVGLPYRAIAGLTAGDLQLDPETGSVSVTVRGRSHVVRPGDDVIVCPVCSLSRWLRTHAVMTRHLATQPLVDHLRSADPVTDTAPHDCRRPLTAQSPTVPLLPPVNQWGHVPFPQTRLSPHAVSRKARDLVNGDVRLHRDLVTKNPAELKPAEPAVEAPMTPALRPYGAAERDAAWNQRRNDLRQLATVAADLDDVERRARELDQRVVELLTRFG